jgi:hypothetical protein
VQLQLERQYEASSSPGFQFRLKRISLARRLAFLADNHELMQKLKFLSSDPNPAGPLRLEIAQLEVALGRQLLSECLVSLGGLNEMLPANSQRIDWLLTEAPAKLCVEVLSRISDEISLSDQRRKN